MKTGRGHIISFESPAILKTRLSSSAISDFKYHRILHCLKNDVHQIFVITWYIHVRINASKGHVGSQRIPKRSYFKAKSEISHSFQSWESGVYWIDRDSSWYHLLLLITVAIHEWVKGRLAFYLGENMFMSGIMVQMPEINNKANVLFVPEELRLFILLIVSN